MITFEKLQRLFFALAFFGFSFFALRRGLAGSKLWLYLFALTLIFGFFVFWLKDRYWLLIPISFFSGFEAIQLFGRNIRASELVIVACSILFLARMALLRIPLRVRPVWTWPILLHFIWVAYIYVINPVGLASMGSESIGGRFYIQILMAFMATIILSCQRITDRDAKLIILFSILFSCFVPLQNYLRFTESVDMTNPDAFYTWHQALTRPAMLLLFFLLAKNRKVNFQFIFLFLAILLLVFASGKRAAFVLFGSLPIIAPWLLYRSYAKAFFRGMIMVLFFGILILGHGTLYNLPLVAQRAMALLPGRWDVSIEHLHEDVFRQEMRNLAWQEIRNRPFMGRRGYTLQRSEVLYMQMSTVGRTDAFGGHAYSANWHSAWLAFWVDFGFPAVLFFAAFLINTLIFGRKIFTEAHDFKYAQILAGMLLLQILSTLITSYTSGHSALTLFGNWWILGLMVAIHRGIHTSQGFRDTLEVEPDTVHDSSSAVTGGDPRTGSLIPPRTVPELA